MEGRTQSKHGGQHTHTPTAIQQGHRVNDKGDADTQTGTPTFDGESVTQPPFTHHATHHPPCHPTIHEGPTLHQREGGADRGYPTTRTAQTHTRTRTPQHLARNSARHDSSTRQHRNGMSRAQPRHCTGQDSSSTPTAIPHTEKDGHHPLTHSSTLTHSCSHNR